MNKPMYSAGILPYTIDKNNKLLFLLGKDTNSFWSDFGGKCELDDRTIEDTACREFYEETLGSVMNIRSIRNHIRTLQGCYKIKSKTLNGSDYYMYVVKIPYKYYQNVFKKMLEFVKYSKCNKRKYLEKVDIMWFSVETIESIIDNNKERNIMMPLRDVFYRTIVNNLESLKSIS